MELVPTDLSTVLSNIKQLKIDREHCLIIMYNTLCAVNFMHTSNIVHRDIKPSNILVFSDCSMKLCDFGLSRSLPDSDMNEIYQEVETLNQVTGSSFKYCKKNWNLPKIKKSLIDKYIKKQGTFKTKEDFS